MDHNYNFLAHYKIRDVVAVPNCREDGPGAKIWDLTICNPRYTVETRIRDLSRLEILIYLTLLGLLPTGIVDLHGALERAREWCDQISKGPFPSIFGCNFDLSLKPNGKWDLEFQPGMGTTVARMKFTTMDDALQALLGILSMLSVQRGDKVPYLQRTQEWGR